MRRCTAPRRVATLRAIVVLPTPGRPLSTTSITGFSIPGQPVALLSSLTGHSGRPRSMLTGMVIPDHPRCVGALALAAVLAASHAALLAQAPAAPATPPLAAAPAPRAVPAWVTKSNELARVWLEAQATLSPESAGQTGPGRAQAGITQR